MNRSHARLNDFLARVYAAKGRPRVPTRIEWIGDTFTTYGEDGKPMLFGGRSFYQALKQLKPL